MAARDESLTAATDQQERLGTTERSRITDIEGWLKSLRAAINTLRGEILTALNASARTPASGEPAHAAAISFVAGASTVSAVTVQLQDADGDAIAHAEIVDVYLSDAATGIGITGTAADGISVTTGALIGTLTTNKAIRAVTDATGKLVFDLTSTAKTAYYVVATPVGALSVSAQMETADYGA